MSAPYRHAYPIDDALRRTWGLSSTLTDLFNCREGSICPHCGVNLRGQGLAKAILDSKYGFGEPSLKAWVRAANAEGLAVCEINIGEPTPPTAAIAQSIERVQLSKPRFNQGTSGRGAHFGRERVARVQRLAAFYPDVDFSPIGVHRH